METEAITSVYAAARSQIKAEIATIEAEIQSLLKAKSEWSQQPAVAYQNAIATYYTPKMAEALKASFTGVDAAIADARRRFDSSTKKAAGNAAQGMTDAAAVAAAQAAINSHVKLSPQEARQILTYIYGESYMTGVHAAVTQIGSGGTPPPPTRRLYDSQEWKDWEPSEMRAARLLRDGGLQDMLEKSGLNIGSIIGDILDTALTRMGNTLADGMNAGLPPEALAQAIEDSVSANAMMIAVTESGRAQSAATIQTYDENGIGQYNWLAEDDACKDCRTNADNGPYDVPEGGSIEDLDPMQPEHPNCRCCYLPVVLVDGENVAPTSDEGDQAQGTTEQDGETPLGVEGEPLQEGEAPLGTEGEETQQESPSIGEPLQREDLLPDIDALEERMG